MERRTAHVEVRTHGRTIQGVAMAYGKVGHAPHGPEVFQPGAFGVDPGSRDVLLNFEHDVRKPLARTLGGGLSFVDSRDALRFVATLPETTLADDVLALIRGRVVSGASIEFTGARDSWQDGVRHVRSARLVGLGLVTRPAYQDSTVSVSIRRRSGKVSGGYRYGSKRTISDRGRRRKRQVSPGAFGYNFDQIQEELKKGQKTTVLNVDEVQARTNASGQNAPIASLRARTLELEDSPTELSFEATVPDTQAVRDLRAVLDSPMGRVVGVEPRFRIPPRSALQSNAVVLEPEEGNEEVLVETVNHAILTHVDITVRPGKGVESFIQESRSRFVVGGIPWPVRH